MENQEVKNPEADKPPTDNLEIANAMFENLFIPFSQSLEKLSRKQLVRVIKCLVKFPFLEKKEMNLKEEIEKGSFMFGERIIYANMVKRARLELDRAFKEVEDQKDTEKSKSKKTKEKKNG